MSDLTRDNLWIMYSTGSGHEETTGLTIYGRSLEIGADKFHISKSFLSEIWVDSKLKFQLSIYEVENCAGCAIAIDIKVIKWPQVDLWLDILEKTHRYLIDCGTDVVWCGNELCSPNVGVLNPDLLYGDVYAAYTKSAGFFCNSNLDTELKYLDDDQLSLVWDTLPDEIQKSDF